MRLLLILIIFLSLTQLASAERWRGLVASVVALESAKIEVPKTEEPKIEEPKIEDKGPSLEETDIKILDNLIDELFNIDEDRAVELENKSS